MSEKIKIKKVIFHICSQNSRNYFLYHSDTDDILYTNIVFITKYSITQLYTVQDTT